MIKIIIGVALLAAFVVCIVVSSIMKGARNHVAGRLFSVVGVIALVAGVALFFTGMSTFANSDGDNPDGGQPSQATEPPGPNDGTPNPSDTLAPEDGSTPAPGSTESNGSEGKEGDNASSQTGGGTADQTGSGGTDGTAQSTSGNDATDDEPDGFVPPEVEEIITGFEGLINTPFRELVATYASVPNWYIRSTNAAMTGARVKFTGYSNAFSIPLLHYQSWYDEGTFFEKTDAKISDIEAEDFPLISPTVAGRIKELDEELAELKKGWKKMTKAEQEEALEELMEQINDEVRNRIMYDPLYRHAFFTAMASIKEVYENNKDLFDSYFEMVAEFNDPEAYKDKEYTLEELRELPLGLDFFLECDLDHPDDIRYLRHTEASMFYSYYAAKMYDEMVVNGIWQNTTSWKNWILDPARKDDRIISVVESKKQESKPAFVKEFVTKEGEILYDVRVGFNMKDGRIELFQLTKSSKNTAHTLTVICKDEATDQQIYSFSAGSHKKGEVVNIDHPTIAGYTFVSGPSTCTMPDKDATVYLIYRQNPSENENPGSSTSKHDGQGGKDPIVEPGVQGSADEGGGDSNPVDGGNGDKGNLAEDKANETKYHEEAGKLGDDLPDIAGDTNNGSTATEENETYEVDDDGNVVKVTTIITTRIESEENDGLIGGGF